MIKLWLGACIAFTVAIGMPNAMQAQESYHFLLPGEFVITQDSADVTGDGIDDKVYLIGAGEQKSGLANNVNIIVEDGRSKEISRSLFNGVSGYRGSLVVSDFNGDKIKDVMFLLQKADMRMFAYAVAFHKAEPDIIYQPKADGPEVRSGEAVITAADNKKTVRVKKDSTIQLRLPENPSTGYTWQFTQSTGGECVLFLGQQSLIPESEQAMAGKPGLAVFSFRALQKGILEMSLANYRSWEGAESKIDSFQVTVEIVD